MRVLIVEDEKKVAGAVRRGLEAEGFAVDVALTGTDGLWKGSGRSIPSFDLHGALGACSTFLERFGGHRAAAGLSIAPDRVEPFAEAFAAQAEGLLGPEAASLIGSLVVAQLWQAIQGRAALPQAGEGR